MSRFSSYKVEVVLVCEEIGLDVSKLSAKEMDEILSLSINSVKKTFKENGFRFIPNVIRSAYDSGEIVQLGGPYQYFNTGSAEIKKSMMPLPFLVQFVILFGPLPRPVKTGTHLLILSNKGLKLGRRFFNARKSAKIEKVRENLINQFS